MSMINFIKKIAQGADISLLLCFTIYQLITEWDFAKRKGNMDYLCHWDIST